MRFSLRTFLTGGLLLLLCWGCSSVPRYSPKRKGFLDLGFRAAKRSSPRDISGRNRERSIAAAHDGTQAAFRKLSPILSRWRWPVEDVQVTSEFGSRNGSYHDGVDLRASIGTPVYSVDDGKVIYSGSKIKGYGKMLVIRHEGGLTSVYAHNSELKVRVGESVRRGQKIALSGNTGRSSGPHLHFEVRYGVVALDPRRVLSGTASASSLTQQAKANLSQKRRAVASSR